MVQEGEVGVVAMTDEVAMGYYLMILLSKPYALQADTEGVSGMVGARAMVVDAVYFNKVNHAPYWYMMSGETTVVKVGRMLRTGLHMQQISMPNKLPQACNRFETRRQKAVRVDPMDHDAIMEEARKCNRLQ
jgi:hypothetical protein